VCFRIDRLPFSGTEHLDADSMVEQVEPVDGGDAMIGL